MLNILKEKFIKIGGNTQTRYNFLREYLQLLILKIADTKGYFRNIAFVGGTALRILYDLNRFSEYLDFSLTDSVKYDFTQMMEEITAELRLNNLAVETKYKATKSVAAGWFKFSQLLYELNLAPLKNQKLSIKIEVDLNPPSGYKTQLTLIQKEFLIAINHFDLPSLYAGKLHAVLCRKYSKGRDFYDLLWYLGKKIEPNYHLLEQAILQTENKTVELDADKLKIMLRERIDKVDFAKMTNELLPFLVDPNEKHYFNKDFFLSLFQQQGQVSTTI